MRGALVIHAHAQQHLGIIPADAGSTRRSASMTTSREDHPRGCGEHPGFQGAGDGCGGSSPRMRGAPRFPVRPSPWNGIIPADAGSTSSGVLLLLGSRDHPRGCGEHPQRRRGGESHRGSSPRMRGAPRVSVQAAVREGIIPADAGSTTFEQLNFRQFTDHPRGCGEHGYHRRQSSLLLGSSPRMQGALP